MTSTEFLTWDGILNFWQFVAFAVIAFAPPIILFFVFIGFLYWLLGGKK